MPGTESQTALDALNRNFPQAAGITAQAIVVAPPGTTVRDEAVEQAIEDGAEAFERIDGVLEVTSPFDEFAKGMISPDSSAAIMSIRLERVDGQVPDATLAALTEETQRLQAACRARPPPSAVRRSTTRPRASASSRRSAWSWP